MTEIQYEYTSGTCDVWQLGHLANFFAEKRWEPVFAVEAQQGIKVSSRIGDENGGSYEALKPYEVLFRRALKTEDDEEAEARAAVAAACTCPGCMTAGKCIDDPERWDEDDAWEADCRACPDDCQICSDTPHCDCPTHGEDQP